MLALRHHFDGPDAVTSRLAQATARLSTIHYKNEKVKRLSEVAMLLHSCYNLITRYEPSEAYTNRQKVAKMTLLINGSSEAQTKMLWELALGRHMGLPDSYDLSLQSLNWQAG